MREDAMSFETLKEQQDYECLLKELRCMTCPNQSIADSSAPIAVAMQEEIYHRLKQHDKPEQIRNDLLASYGDYISYKPMLKPETYGLWFGPIVLLVLGLVLWSGFFKRKTKYDE